MILRFTGKLVNRVLNLVFGSSPSTDPISVTVGGTEIFGVDPTGNVTCGLVNNVDLSAITPAEVTQAELDAVQAQVTALDTEVDGKASVSALNTLAGRQHTLTWYAETGDTVLPFPKYFAGDGSGNTGYKFPQPVHIKRMTVVAYCADAFGMEATMRAFIIKTGTPTGGNCDATITGTGFARGIRTYSGDGIALTTDDEFTIELLPVGGMWYGAQVIVDYTID